MASDLELRIAALEKRYAELQQQQEDAKYWGAAVGARYDEMRAISLNLIALSAMRDQGKPAEMASERVTGMGILLGSVIAGDIRHLPCSSLGVLGDEIDHALRAARREGMERALREAIREHRSKGGLMLEDLEYMLADLDALERDGEE